MLHIYLNFCIVGVHLTFRSYKMYVNFKKCKTPPELKYKADITEEGRTREKAFLTEPPDEGEPEDIKMAREQLKVLEDEKSHTEKVRRKVDKELQTSRNKAARLEQVKI